MSPNGGIMGNFFLPLFSSFMLGKFCTISMHKTSFLKRNKKLFLHWLLRGPRSLCSRVMGADAPFRAFPPSLCCCPVPQGGEKCVGLFQLNGISTVAILVVKPLKCLFWLVPCPLCVPPSLFLCSLLYRTDWLQNGSCSGWGNCPHVFLGGVEAPRIPQGLRLVAATPTFPCRAKHLVLEGYLFSSLLSWPQWPWGSKNSRFSLVSETRKASDQ